MKRDLYGNSIALIIHSVDRSLFSHWIAIRSFEGSLWDFYRARYSLT